MHYADIDTDNRSMAVRPFTTEENGDYDPANDHHYTNEIIPIPTIEDDHDHYRFININDLCQHQHRLLPI
ncbi:hypothetical protein BCS62_09660 [Vibrio cyclitrophicus]